jgi:hypothetical protein
LHTPAGSQLLVPLQLLSSALATTVVHVPEAFAHDRQGVVQLSAQHVLSMQLPLRHSVPTAQTCPFSFLHTPAASQVLVPLQKLSSPLATMVVQLPAAFAQERQGVVQAF